MFEGTDLYQRRGNGIGQRKEKDKIKVKWMKGEKCKDKKT